MTNKGGESTNKNATTKPNRKSWQKNDASQFVLLHCLSAKKTFSVL